MLVIRIWLGSTHSKQKPKTEQIELHDQIKYEIILPKLVFNIIFLDHEELSGVDYDVVQITVFILIAPFDKSDVAINRRRKNLKSARAKVVVIRFSSYFSKLVLSIM